MNELPRQKLCEIITQYSKDICNNPQRCEGLLRDFCGQYSKEVFLLVNALKKGVATELVKSQAQIPESVILAKLTKRLQDELGIAEEAAYWAVDSWGLALGIISEPRSKNDLESREQLILQREQEVEKQQKQKEEYEKELHKSDREIEIWVYISALLSGSYTFLLIGLAILSVIIYVYQQSEKTQEISNLSEEMNNLTSQYNQKVAKLTEQSNNLKGQIENLTDKKKSLYNEVQNFQNSLKDLENNLENNLNFSGDTYLNLCNTTSNDTISTTFMYQEGEVWKSKGWWVIKKGECTKLFVRLNYRGYIYLHGQTNNLTWGSKDFSFCVKNSAFEFEKADEIECSGENYKANAIQFFVFPGVNNYNFKDYKLYTE